MNALTIKDGQELTRLEKVIEQSPLKDLAKALTKIERDWESCRAALLALVQIRDRQLFRTSNKNFEGYLMEKWDLEKRWFDRLANWMAVNVISRPIGLKLCEHQARQVNAEANQKAAQNGTSKDVELEELCRRRKEERERDEAQARRDAPRVAHAERDRIKAIIGKIDGALRLNDGSIDVADQGEAILLKARAVYEGASIIEGWVKAKAG